MNLHHVNPCEKQQIDTSQHNIVAELEEHKYKFEHAASSLHHVCTNKFVFIRAGAVPEHNPRNEDN